MSQSALDLVRDARLETTFAADETSHTFYISNTDQGIRRQKVVEKWKRGKVLGRGGFGTVWLERRIDQAAQAQGRLRAVKMISKSSMDGGDEESNSSTTVDYRRELEAVAKFSHPRYGHCFVSSSGWYEDETDIYIAMEYISYGDLKRFMVRPFPEPEARNIAQQLVEALVCLHNNSFVHRDLKPNNILVVRPGPNWWVKLADFGISKRYGTTAASHTSVGTDGFTAPEVLRLFPRTYLDYETAKPSAADIWALGEVTYRLVTKRPVFPGLGDLYQYVTQQCSLPIEELIFGGSSSLFCQFIEETMAANPSDRPAASELANHPLFSEDEPQAQQTSESPSIIVSSENSTPQPDSSVFSSEGTASWTTIVPSRPASSPGAAKMETASTVETDDISIIAPNSPRNVVVPSPSPSPGGRKPVEDGPEADFFAPDATKGWTTISPSNPIQIGQLPLTAPVNEPVAAATVSVPQVVVSADDTQLQLEAMPSYQFITAIPESQRDSLKIIFSFITFGKYAISWDALIHAATMNDPGMWRLNLRTRCSELSRTLKFDDPTISSILKLTSKGDVVFQDPGFRDVLQKLPADSRLSLADKEQAHLDIARICVRYLHFWLPEARAAEPESVEDTVDDAANFILLEYAAWYWGYHVSLCSGLVETIGDSVMSLIHIDRGYNLKCKSFLHWVNTRHRNSRSKAQGSGDGENSKPEENDFDHISALQVDGPIMEPWPEGVLIAKRNLLNVLQRVGLQVRRMPITTAVQNHGKGMRALDDSALLDLEYVSPKGLTLLHYAAWSGSFDVLRYLLTFNLPDRLLAYDHEGYSVFSLAASHSDGEEVALLLLDMGKGFEAKREGARKVLHWAVRNNHLQLADAVLKLGWDPNVRESKQRTPLFIAAQGDFPDMAKLLLAAGADVSAADIKGFQPVHAAVTHSFDCLKLLLERGDAIKHINEPFHTSRSALHLAMSKPGDRGQATIKYLLSKGADIWIANEVGNLPIHLAARNNAEGLQLLIEHDGSSSHINALNKKGWTPLSHCMMQSQNLKSIRALLEAGADVMLGNPKGRSAMHVCASVGIACLDLILEYHREPQKLNQQDNRGRTPLHIAIALGPLECLTKLLEVGADPNIRDENGFTALHGAAKESLEKVQAIVTCHPRISMRPHSNNGREPIHVAVFHGKLDIVKYLHEVCGIPLGPDRTDTSMRLYARDSGDAALIEYINARAPAEPAPVFNHSPPTQRPWESIPSKNPHGR